MAARKKGASSLEERQVVALERIAQALEDSHKVAAQIAGIEHNTATAAADTDGEATEEGEG